MELIDGEFGPIPVLYRHPGFRPEDMAAYATGNVEVPAYVHELTDVVTFDLAMWRAVRDARHDYTFTSWASSREQALFFLHQGVDVPRPAVKYREKAPVIGMVLQDWKPGEAWIEYLVLDKEPYMTNLEAL